MSMRMVTLLCTLALALPSSFGQHGIYGPVTKSPQAGDNAPDLVFQQALNSGGPATWTSANFSGQVTVLGFFPDTTDNLRTASEWNSRVIEFAAKPVQFVWITSESPSTLEPWLKEHPLRGWVLVDSTGATGRMYGQEAPSTVIVGPDRRIVGFDVAFVPAARTLDAVLEGRIVTTPPDPSELQSFMASGLVLLRSEAMRIPRAEDKRPKFPPSFDLHVSPSKSIGHGDFGSNDYRSLQGFDIKSALLTLYGVSATRMDFPQSLEDGKNYDFSMVIPESEDQEKIEERMRDGILDYFGLAATEEDRALDVYVVTAPEGRVSQPSEETGSMASLGMSSIGMELSTAKGDPSRVRAPLDLAQISSFSAEGTLDDICHVLERLADRPVVNETNVQGEFKIDVARTGSSGGDFFSRLRSQSGLAITPGKRQVKVVVVKFR